MKAFEGLSAGLATALATLEQILVCPSGSKARSSTTESALRRAASLSLQICSDCIPGGVAAELGPWLDRVQENARKLHAGPAE